MTILTTVLRLRIGSRDSKLSWLTTVASMLVLLCSLGFLHGFGILYNAFLEEYQESKEKTGKSVHFHSFIRSGPGKVNWRIHESENFSRNEGHLRGVLVPMF